MDSMDNKDVLLRLNNEVLWWKAQIGFVETDILFINRLLNSNAFDDNPNLFENLQKFGHQIKIEMRQLNNIKLEIDSYQNKLEGLKECDDLSCDATYVKNQELMKNNFEMFLKNFSDFKLKVFNYTGCILRKPIQ